MRFAIKIWVTEIDVPQSETLFGVLDADGNGSLPIPPGEGHWHDDKIVAEVEFQHAADAKKAIAKDGYYLFGSDSIPSIAKIH